MQGLNTNGNVNRPGQAGKVVPSGCKNGLQRFSSRTKFLAGMRRRKRMLQKGLWKRLIAILDWHCHCNPTSLPAEEVALIKSILRPGDILLETNNAYPGWQIAFKLTTGSNWTHSAFYPGGDIVIESGTRPFVAEIPLDSFLHTDHIAVLRPKYEIAADFDSANACVLRSRGKPFNISFDSNDRKSVYCAQLMANALETMPHPIRVPRRKMLWKVVVCPEDLKIAEGIECIWSTKPNIVMNLLSHWPLAMAVALGMLAGSILHAWGVILGGILAGCFFSMFFAFIDREQD